MDVLEIQIFSLGPQHRRNKSLELIYNKHFFFKKKKKEEIHTANKERYSSS